MEPEQAITVNFKVLGNKNLETLELPLDSNLETLRVLVSDFCTIPVEDIRILYKGHAFRETDTLGSVNVPDGATLIVVPTRKPAAPAQPASPPAQSESAPAPQPAPAPHEESEAMGPIPQQQTNQNMHFQGPLGFPINIHMDNNNNNNNNNNSDSEDEPRIEAQQIIDLRKQIVLTQQKLLSLNRELINLQLTISEGNPQTIQEKIDAAKAKIEETLPQVSENVANFQFDPEGEIFIEENNSDEAPDPDDAPTPVVEQPQEEEFDDPDDDAPTPIVEEPAQEPEDPSPVEAPEPEEPSVEQPQTAPEAPQQQPQNPNPQQRPNMANPLGNIFGQLFGGARPQPQQQQADADIFTQEEKDMMAADLAKITQPDYMQSLNDSYSLTDMYHDID